MNSNILEEIESLRLKLEKSSVITPELEIEYRRLDSVLNATIEAQASLCAALNRIEKTFSREINEASVSKSFLTQIFKGKHYGNPGDSDGPKRK